MFYSAQQTQAMPAFGILEFVTYRTEAWSHPPAHSHYSNSHLKGSQQFLYKFIDSYVLCLKGVRVVLYMSLEQFVLIQSAVHYFNKLKGVIFQGIEKGKNVS